MDPRTHVMLDLETLGNGNDARCQAKHLQHIMHALCVDQQGVVL
jgi:hypothetical protein